MKERREKERRVSVAWDEDCMKWRRRVLVGKKTHWCPDWDFLPVDETTPEIDCCACDVPDDRRTTDRRSK